MTSQEILNAAIHAADMDDAMLAERAKRMEQKP